MKDPGQQILKDSIARNVAVVLNAPADGPAASRKARLLAEDPKGIWLECPAISDGLLKKLRETGEPLGVTFRGGEQMVDFVCPMLRRDQAFRLTPSMTVDAMLVGWPTEIRLTQRRNSYRIRPALDAKISIRLWRIGSEWPYEAQPENPDIRAEMRDLSVCGMGIILRPTNGTDPTAEKSDRVRIEMCVGHKPPMLLCGRIVHHPQELPEGMLRIGVKFEGMDQSLVGRRTLVQLDNLVAELQRTEARRRRDA
jgi:c-di-GMP-binding flagellar brake protein YcgR